MSGSGTTAVHDGSGEKEPTGAVTTPVYRTSTFRFATTDDLLRGARGETPGFYTRYGHPNYRAVESKHAALHGAEDSVVFGSGMAALSTVVLTWVKTGERVVCFRDVYGGTRSLLDWLGRQIGLVTTWVPTGDLDAVAKA